MNHRLFRSLTCLAVVIVAQASLADSVTLLDGSVIVGTIEKQHGGKLLIATDFAGKLEIEAAKIKSYVSDKKVNVALGSGDRLVGSISKPGTGEKSVVDTAIGPIAVQPEQVAAIWPEGQEHPDVIAKIDALKPKWTTRVEGGINRKEGNTDSLEGRAKVEILRKTADDQLKFYASADYAEQNKVRNRSEYIAGTRYENNITDRLYWYIRSELENDEFEDLDLRATAAGGLGYYWIKEKIQDLKTSVGAGYRHQSFKDDSTEDDAILDLGLDYRLDINPWAQFTHSTVYSPSLERFSDYLLTLDTALAFPLANSDMWKLKLGVRNDYNSDPRPGRERLDNTYYANVVLELK